MTALILPYRGKRPIIDPAAWIAPNATVTGDVAIGADAGVWFGVVIRGDVHEVRIGRRTNIQDNSVIHCTFDRAEGTYIGDDVTVGHMAMLHACRLESGCFVGMKACVMDGAVVESGAMLAAGALVTPGKRVPAGELWAGNPARKMRDVTEAERQFILSSAARYVAYANGYR